MTRRARREKEDAASGCHWFVVTIVMPLMSLVVAGGGLIHGAMLTIDCRRISSRVVEEVIEQRGSLTIPVARVIDDGRVDAHVQWKILAVVPIRTFTVADVTNAASTSSTTDVRDSGGRRTSSYSSGRLDLTTRNGRVWSSPEISHAIGHAAGEMEARIDEFLASNDQSRLRLWSMSWLSNIIGIGFSLVSLLFVWRWVASLRGNAAAPPPASLL